ncbi:hypothetical protein F6Q07_22645 [Pectobacterium parmentieri]|uniref:hypothetical protein n=1 Tax=Pectobacterium parmentieri TaxID=1905730 RepID=UPI000D611C8B|nr:hypothetical protein [Pectobacterium parmentieri]MBI0520866.1 hypothetical protein [Pectobacterium parmentieri]PWD58528.1 hypothetical protein DF211_19500 [Pectobacterium parmentieri]QQA77064.1 hypothetical protein JBL47_05530 [Pectobacterium parmentieri]
MLTKIDALTGQGLMRLWGVDDWDDPGAEYAVWDECCVFALVPQDGFFDIHMAMDNKRWRDCRKAGAAILDIVGHHRLRAIILPDRPHVCNYAARMGFGRRTTENLITKSGASAPFFIMWRESGEYYGRSC